MKKEINTILILMTLGGLLFNGCVSRGIVLIDENAQKDDYKIDTFKKVEKAKPSFSWEKINPPSTTSIEMKEEKRVIENGFKNNLSSDFENSSRGTKPLSSKSSKDCVDCVVSVPIRNSKIVSVSKPIQEVYSFNNNVESISKNIESITYEYEGDRIENNYIVTEQLESFPLIENFSEKISIQIGAFRRYAGAKVYAKKYNLLSNQYKVEIKENVKDNRPLYRVRIEGFPNEFEAKDFIARYGLTEAFLVRK